MKNKSLVVQILSMAVVLAGIYGGFFGPTGQAALGVLSFAITALLQSPILSSGTWPTGWGQSIWIAQIAGVVIQVANFAADSAVIDPAVVNIFVLTLNAFLTTFVKDFGSGSMVASKLPCE